ncbi:putative myosin-binding protein [Helianthus annuus]|nr:putative myosin-binding protein [Helianthus annuus]KAJ0748232.1 putative myosin-binding protein [Helianthus annuus]
MSKRTFRMFVEEELGEFPHFVVGAILEWFLIASLFIDGFIAFLSHQFATIFQLDPPCVLCTRIDQSLASTNPSSYYNNSICESHKKDISSLAYCHVHRKLSDIRNMCDGCLISFQTDKESDCLDTKNLVEPEGSNGYKDGDPEMKLKQVKTGKETANASTRVAEMSKCSCCGESFKKRTSSKVFVRTPSNLRASLTAPAFSPRVPLTPMGWRNDDAKNVELNQMRYTELKFVSDNEPDVPEDDYGLNTDSKIKDDMKSTAATLLADTEELTEESLKTPTYGKGNKFFGAPLAESAVANSPRFGNKLAKKFPLDRPDLVTDLSDDTPVEGDSTLQVLKRQVRSDKRMLMVLYQELNAERNASAVAANNSMAMITRLQAEKASIEMEALQYQRMMEEQAEYDDEAIQILKDMLIQKEKDIKVMEAELEAYREKYGDIKKKERDEVVSNSDYQATESEKKQSNFETERHQLSGMLNNLENLIQSSSDDGDHADKDRGEEKKATLEREMSIIKEKMSEIEADSGYLKTTLSFQKGDERADLLTEIAQNLRKLRT